MDCGREGGVCCRQLGERGVPIVTLCSLKPQELGLFGHFSQDLSKFTEAAHARQAGFWRKSGLSQQILELLDGQTGNHRGCLVGAVTNNTRHWSTLHGVATRGVFLDQLAQLPSCKHFELERTENVGSQAHPSSENTLTCKLQLLTYCRPFLPQPALQYDLPHG